MADRVDELYALPLDEFTRARNELAKELGDPEIRKLKKPSVSAWAANQLARKREVDVRRLLRAGERLEKAQRAIVSGKQVKGFEDARRDERDAVRRLRGEAASILGADGHPASDATLERVAATLHAAAATEDGRELLRRGRLAEDLEPMGFGVFEGIAPRPAARRRATPKPSPPPRVDRRAAKARADAEAARAEAAAADKEARRAEHEAERLRKAAERAADRAARLEARARELNAG